MARQGWTKGGDGDQSGGKKEDKKAIIKLKMPDSGDKEKAVAVQAPIKLTLKIGRASTEVPVVEPVKTRVTPKLTLSIRKPPPEHLATVEEEIVDVGTHSGLVPKKRGRKKGFKFSKSLESTSTDETVKVKKAKQASAASASAPTSLKASMEALPRPAAPKVPIQPTPKYSEEDRQVRLVVGEVIQQKVALAAGHRQMWMKPGAKAGEVVKALWPFYELLAVTEINPSLLYKQGGLAVDDNSCKHSEEFNALVSRFDSLTLAQKLVPNY